MFSQINDQMASGRFELNLYSRAENALSQGLMLKRWWERTDENDAYANKFELTRIFNEPSSSFGFFDCESICGRSLPIMGEVEDRLFDLTKYPNNENIRTFFREFVLKYLMRVSDFRRPSMFSEGVSQNDRGWLQYLSWCPKEDIDRKGFGYSQCYYKLRDGGQIEMFPPEKRFQIVDLRELATVYEWIILKVRIFDFSVSMAPVRDNGLKITIPLEESSYLVLSSAFVEDQDKPKVDAVGRTVVGQYGFGYAFIKGDEELLGYGPGQFDVAFQQIVFRIYEDGETRVKLVFVANRPKRIVNIPLAPLDWCATLANTLSVGMAAPFIDLLRPSLRRFPFRFGSVDPVSLGVQVANLLTGGQAARRYCISRQQLEKTFLVKHFDQHYQMINGALQTWREIRDWTDEASLPDWVKTGVSS